MIWIFSKIIDDEISSRNSSIHDIYFFSLFSSSNWFFIMENHSSHEYYANNLLNCMEKLHHNRYGMFPSNHFEHTHTQNYHQKENSNSSVPQLFLTTRWRRSVTEHSMEGLPCLPGNSFRDPTVSLPLCHIFWTNIDF